MTDLISIQSFSYEDEELYQASFLIRTKVFVEEQLVDPSTEKEFEEDARYYLLFLGETPIATARWRTVPGGIKLERFAVFGPYRNQGYGSVLLDRVLADVLPLKLTVFLHAQLKAVNYYSRRKFVMEGENFLEANILHCKMVLLST